MYMWLYIHIHVHELHFPYLHINHYTIYTTRNLYMCTWSSTFVHTMYNVMYIHMYVKSKQGKWRHSRKKLNCSAHTCTVHLNTIYMYIPITCNSCTHTSPRSAGESDNGGVVLSWPSLRAVISISTVKLDVRVAHTYVHWRLGHVS